MNLIFSGCKCTLYLPSHIFIAPDATFLEKFHQSCLLSVLQNGLFLQNKEQEHEDHHNVGQSSQD